MVSAPAFPKMCLSCHNMKFMLLYKIFLEVYYFSLDLAIKKKKKITSLHI